MKIKNQIGFIFVLLILANTIAFSSTSTAQAATLFADDFETNDYSKWQGVFASGGAALAISSNPVFAGQYSADCSIPGTVGSYAFVYKNVAGPVVYHREYIRISSLPQPGAETDLFGIMDQVATGFHLGTIAIQNDNSIFRWKLEYYHNGAEQAAYSTAVPLKIDTWYYIEIMVKPGASNGQVSVWIAEDKTSISESSPTINIPNLNVASSIGAVFFGGYITGAAYPVHIFSDSIVVSDAWVGPRDFTAPIMSAISSTATSIGATTTMRSVITDDVGIDYVIFSWNNTGTWVNQTAIDADDRKNFTASFTGNLNSTSQTVVSAIFYSNDTSDNWARTNQANFTLNAYTVTLTANQTGAIQGDRVNFTITVTKNGAVFNNYLVNITKDGTAFTTTNITGSFTDIESAAIGHRYNASLLYDLTLQEYVTYTTNTLNVVWAQSQTSPTPSPTSTPLPTQNPTSTPRPTAKPSPTAKPTATIVPTLSPTPTSTIKPTATPPGTQTEIPQWAILAIVIVVIAAILLGVLLLLKKKNIKLR